MTALPEELASWPSYAPAPAVLGQVELLLDGIRGPAAVATLDVPAPVGEAAAAAGHLVLTDEEGTPLADIAVAGASAADDAEYARIAGPVRALRPFHAGPFRGLRRQPGEVRELLAGRPAVAVVLDRPLTLAEERALAEHATAYAARVLVLPCVGSAGPTGLPPEILVRNLQASVPRLATAAGPALLVPLPLVTGSDNALADEFAQAAGAMPADPVVAPSPAGWNRIAAALEAGPGVLEDVVAGDVAAVLRSWRPPRAERGLTVFFTGLSGSGKSTLARALADILLERGRTVTHVDGDVARRLLSSGLGFGREDRDLNIRRIGWVASEVTKHGGVAVCAPIAPFAATRAEVRRMVEAHGGFVLVHVATPLAVCEARDRKGLYAKARAGLIPEFTGVSSPYEEPADADVRIDTSTMPVDDAVAAGVGYLEGEGWLRPP